MKTPIVLLPSLLLAHPALGYNTVEYNAYPSGFTNGSGPAAGAAIFANANQNPNVTTHTVRFRHDSLFTSSDPIYQNWTWTISVSDVAMPNGSNLYDTGLPKSAIPRVAYTTYSFSWPEQGGLNEALQAEANSHKAGEGSPPSCAYLITALLPEQVAKDWDPSSSDCTSALGADCVGNLTKILGNSGSRSCNERSVFVSDPEFISACASSFGVPSEMGGWGVSSYEFGSVGPSGDNAPSLAKGEVYAYALSEVYAAGNSTIFSREVDNLHVLGLSGYTGTALLCNSALGTAKAPDTGAGTGLRNMVSRNGAVLAALVVVALSML